MPEFKVTLDGISKGIRAQGSYPHQRLALIDHSDQCIRLELPPSFHPRSPQILAPEAIVLVVLALIVFDGGEYI